MLCALPFVKGVEVCWEHLVENFRDEIEVALYLGPGMGEKKDGIN